MTEGINPVRGLDDLILDSLVEAGAAGEGHEVDGLQRLSGGANMETWRFVLRRGQEQRPLILRRRPSGVSEHRVLPTPLPLAAEAELIGLARRNGVPVPTVLAVAGPHTEIGESIVMTCLEGEALPQKILRSPDYSNALGGLAFQCGETLGNLHRVDLADCPGGLRDLTWDEDLERLQTLCDQFANPSPTHQLALNWFRSQPAPVEPRALCHGDFRMGNLLIGPRGLNAVLDWELAHVGFAGEDLGYLCANVWRFGGKKPVGGFGDYRQLIDGYRTVSDYAPTVRDLLFWQLYAALGWGLVCLTMLELHRSGADSSLERAAVGRRLSESDVDTLLLLEELES